MSDYILHNISLTVSPQLDLFQLLEPDKPVEKYPNYYLGKIIGSKGHELELNRTRRGGGVLRAKPTPFTVLSAILVAKGRKNLERNVL